MLPVVTSIFDGHFSFTQCLLLLITMKKLNLFINLVEERVLQKFAFLCMWFVYYLLSLYHNSLHCYTIDFLSLKGSSSLVLLFMHFFFQQGYSGCPRGKHSK